MPDISIVMVAKIVEGALENDMVKVKSYAELIAKLQEQSGDDRSARIIRSRLDGSYKNSPKVVLDNVYNSTKI